jgi:hypothetical protein
VSDGTEEKQVRPDHGLELWGVDVEETWRPEHVKVYDGPLSPNLAARPANDPLLVSGLNIRFDISVRHEEENF